MKVQWQVICNKAFRPFSFKTARVMSAKGVMSPAEHRRGGAPFFGAGPCHSAAVNWRAR